MDRWMGLLEKYSPGWLDGCKSHYNNCLQHSNQKVVNGLRHVVFSSSQFLSLELDQFYCIDLSRAVKHCSETVGCITPLRNCYNLIKQRSDGNY